MRYRAYRVLHTIGKICRLRLDRPICCVSKLNFLVQNLNSQHIQRILNVILWAPKPYLGRLHFLLIIDIPFIFTTVSGSVSSVMGSLGTISDHPNLCNALYRLAPYSYVE